jgi:hypothetical protein
LLKNFFNLLTKADRGLLITLVFLIMGSFAFFLKNNTTNSGYAECRINAGRVINVNLHKNREVNLHNGMILEVYDSRIRVKKSHCQNQICVKQGWIKTANDIIVCVPNRTIIYLKKNKNKVEGLDYISQ